MGNRNKPASHKMAQPPPHPSAERRALREFIAWYQEIGATGLSKATVQAHITHLRANGVTASSINQWLTTLRKFAREATQYIDDAAIAAARASKAAKSLDS